MDPSDQPAPAVRQCCYPAGQKALSSGDPVRLAETFRFDVNWGDATVHSTGDATIDQVGNPGEPTVGSFGGSHIYADDGTYTVTVRVADDDMAGNFLTGTVGTDFVQETFQVTVTNVAPTPTLVEKQTVFEGTSLNLAQLGTFTDPGFVNPNNPNGAQRQFDVSRRGQHRRRGA